MISSSVTRCALAALLLTGCAAPFSATPTATNFSSSKQQKLQASSHWNVIAQDVASQLAANLKNRQPLYVNQANSKTVFDRTFGNNLVSALISAGFTVQTNPTNALQVSFETQAIPFSFNRAETTLVGGTTALASGIWALQNASAGVVVGTAIVAKDVFRYVDSEFTTGPTPSLELVITTSIVDSSTFLARNTSSYYVADTDRQLYVITAPPPAPITIYTKVIGVAAQ